MLTETDPVVRGLLDEIVEGLAATKADQNRFLARLAEIVSDIKLAQPDLSQLATTVASSVRYPTSEEIAQAIAKVVHFPDSPDIQPTLERVSKALEGLEKQRPAASPVGFGNTKVQVRSTTETPVHVELTNPGDIGSPARPATPTMTSVPSSATSVELLAANTDRLGATIVNDSTSLLYVKLGVTASATSFTATLAPKVSDVCAYYEIPFSFTGPIDGIWVAANGFARVTELEA